MDGATGCTAPLPRAYPVTPRRNALRKFNHLPKMPTFFPPLSQKGR